MSVENTIDTFANDEATALRVGRFGGRLFGTVGIAVTLWGLASGTAWDLWLIGIVAGCSSGYLLSLAPWDGNGEVLIRVMATAAAFFVTAFAPYFVSHPVMLVLHALLTAYIGANLDHRWFLLLLPPTATLALALSAEVGVRAGVADTALYMVLWATVGSIVVWMRQQLESGSQALLDAQADRSALADAEAERQAADTRRAETELDRRAEVAQALHTSIEAVTEASAGIEEQSTTIAAAVEEMAMSLREAGSTAARTESSLQRIASATVGSQDSIARLDSAGKEIVGIVDTITDLSEQTNLLALNATIESARAGAAGKGFAVVANEVKDLAHRTAKSASEISTVVDHIQQRLTASNDAIEAIADLVANLESDQLALSAAVSQQTEVVEGISVSAASGAAGILEIGQAIRDLDRNAAALAANG